MPVVNTTRYAPASIAMTIAQNLLNDPAGVLYAQINTGDSVPEGQVNLVPFLNMALGDLRALLGNNGVQVRVTTEIDLPVNTTGDLIGQTNEELSDVSSPQLPTDCIVPLKMWEQPTESGQLFIPMKKLDQLPNLEPGQTLNFWQWEDDQINLVGATQNTTVRLLYESSIPVIIDPTDPVPLAFTAETLGKGCAAYAAFSDAGMTPDVSALFDAFEKGMERIVIRYTKAGQFKPRRRRPYGFRKRIVYL